MTAINFYYSLGNEDVGYGVFFDGADTLFCMNCNKQIHHIEGDYGNCVSDCEKHSRALSKILCTFNQLYGDGSDSYSDSDSDDDSDTSSRNSAAVCARNSAAVCARNSAAGGARNSAAGGARNSAAGGARNIAAGGARNSAAGGARNSAAGGARNSAAGCAGAHSYSIEDLDFRDFYPDNEMN